MEKVEFTITAEQCSALAAAYGEWSEASSSFSEGVLSVNAEHAGPIGDLLGNETMLKARQLDAFKAALKKTATVRQQKADEAKAFLADPDPNPENYPLLLAEIGVAATALE